MMEMLDYCMTEATLLLQHSLKILPVFDKALLDAQSAFKARSEGDNNGYVVKPFAHVRLTNIPICPDLHRYTVPRSNDIGSLLMISGTVIRAGEIKMEERYKVYECQKCSGQFKVFADDCLHNEIPKPVICMAKPERRPSNSSTGSSSPPMAVSCVGTSFKLVKPRSNIDLFKSVQEVRLQEHISKLAVGRVIIGNQSMRLNIVLVYF